jgi:hypothetical protein
MPRASTLAINLPYMSYAPFDIEVTHRAQQGREDSTVRYIKEADAVEQGMILSEERWEALRKAEMDFWQGTHAPTLGWTDVQCREDSSMVARVWEDCFQQMDAACEFDSARESASNAEELIMSRVSHRVARALAVLVFGPDILLR